MPPSTTAATALSSVRLAELTRQYAGRCRSGDFPFIEFDAGERWHRRIYRDRRVDVWLISWLPSQGTELHDHGLSAGSFTVVDGELTELLPSGWNDAWMTLRSQARPAGKTVSFGRHYIHDVVNRGTKPAVSVHAYSPPLTSMRFYDLAGGELTMTRSLATDDPEPTAAAPGTDWPGSAAAIRRAS